MDEVVFYAAGEGASPSPAAAASLHRLNHYASFRDVSCPPNGSSLTAMGRSAHLISALLKSALLTVHAWGKDSVHQRFPVPEPLSCLELCPHPPTTTTTNTTTNTHPTPWLCAAGSASGKLYLWELALGALLATIDAHYQKISSISFSKDAAFMVTTGLDARTSVWRVCDLCQLYQSDRRHTPFFSITDHSLAVTGACIVGVCADARLYTCLRDATLRIYNLQSRSHLATIVLPCPAECVAVDPAHRQAYVGLDNGQIRIVPLFHAKNAVWLPVVGAKAVVTVPTDLALDETFVHHQQNSDDATAFPKVCAIALLFDATVVVSGDSLGRVMAADVATRQVTRTFPACAGPILCIKVGPCPAAALETGPAAAPKSLSPFQRVLASALPLDHALTCTIPSRPANQFDFGTWIQQVAAQEMAFKNYSPISSKVHTVAAPGTQLLQHQLNAVSEAYTELREKHEALLQRFAVLLEKE